MTNVTSKTRKTRKPLYGVVTWVRLPPPVHARLVERAGEEARPMSDVVRRAVESYLGEAA